MDISVVIPAYNEEAVILSTLQDVVQYLKRRGGTWEVIVVDDGSTDGTVRIVQQIKAVSLIRLPRNRGKGFAVKTGMRAAVGEYVLFMDADNSTNIKELDHCLREMQAADIVIGSRSHAHSTIAVSQNALKRISGRIGNMLIRVGLGIDVHDTQCGFKVFNRRSLDVFRYQIIDRWGFDFEILFLAKKKGFRIVESPVTWINNRDSKVRSLDYFKVLIELFMVRWRSARGVYNKPAL